MGNCLKGSSAPASTTRLIVPSTAIPPDIEDINDNPNAAYCSNLVKTTKYTIFTFLPLNLWEQFHRFANVYFIFIVILNFMPEISAFAKEVAPIPVIFVLCVTGVKDAYDDYQRYKADKKVNHAICEVYSSETNDYVNEEWQHLRPGDIVRLKSNTMIPADILVLHSTDRAGICHVETANLDGETNLKQREVVRGFVSDTFNPDNFLDPIEVEVPNNEIFKFNGKMLKVDGDVVTLRKENLILRGCVMRNTVAVQGMVIYAGNETKAMLSNKGPRFKRSKLERQINKDVIWCFIILLLCCLVVAIGGGVWLHSFPGADIPYISLVDANSAKSSPAFQGFLNFWTSVIIFQALIPLPLYVTIELVKMGQVFHLRRDIELYDEQSNKPVEVKASNITEDLGQIQYVFSDKTGTLTENQMIFKRCSISGVDYEYKPEGLSEGSIDSHTPILGKQNSMGNGDVNVPRVPSDKPSDFIEKDQGCESSAVEPISTSTLMPTVKAISFVQHSRAAVSKETQRIQDFTLVMAICNTAVVSINKNDETPDDNIGMDEDDTDTDEAMQAVQTRRRQRGQRKKPTIPVLRNLIKGDKSRSGTSSPTTSLRSAKNQKTLAPPKDKKIRTSPVVKGKMARGTKQIKVEEIKDEEIKDEVLKMPELSTKKGFLPPIQVDMSGPAIQPITPEGSQYDTPDNISLANTLDSLDNMDGGSKEPGSLDTGRGSLLPPDSIQRSSSFTSMSVCSSVGDLASLGGAFGSTTGGMGAKCPIGEELLLASYETESPDEMSLVKTACQLGCKLLQRGPGFVTVWVPEDGPVTLEVLHVLPFDSDRKRMSVIFRHPYTKEVILYCKGADSSILPNLQIDRGPNSDFESFMANTQHHLNMYSCDGLRTLALTKRIVPEMEYQDWVKRFNEAEQKNIDNTELQEKELGKLMAEIEHKLILLGVTGIEDRLQDGVPETIEALRQAGISVWVLTGDKQETAINIAHAAKLITDKHTLILLNATSKSDLCNQLIRQLREIKDHYPDEVEIRQRRERPPIREDLALCIDGTSLEFALDKDVEFDFLLLAEQCSSVICCRATPMQKSEVVRLVRDNLRMQTLAIGDGANDVNMIQTADVGVGISGLEGMQAVLASDFAISRFRFLKRLLLVHGHWSYDKLARMALYMFYKDAILIFVLFWFQLFNGFSGSTMIDQVFLLMFNLIMSSLPPLVSGIWDKDFKASTLMNNPCIYREGIQCKSYLPYHFWLNMADAVWQSLVIFFLSYIFYLDSDVGLWSFGDVCTNATTLCVLVHIGIETKSWTGLHWMGVIGSYVIAWYVFAIFYNMTLAMNIGPETSYYVILYVSSTPLYWLSIPVTIIVALLPRLAFRALHNSMWPSLSARALYLEKIHGEGAVLPLDVHSTVFPVSRSRSLSVLRTPRRVRPMSAPTSDKGTEQHNGLPVMLSETDDAALKQEVTEDVEMSVVNSDGHHHRDKREGSRRGHRRSKSSGTIVVHSPEVDNDLERWRQQRGDLDHSSSWVEETGDGAEAVC